MEGRKGGVRLGEVERFIGPRSSGAGVCITSVSGGCKLGGGKGIGW